jgi:hypothetical protein
MFHVFGYVLRSVERLLDISQYFDVEFSMLVTVLLANVFQHSPFFKHVHNNLIYMPT